MYYFTFHFSCTIYHLIVIKEMVTLRKILILTFLFKLLARVNLFKCIYSRNFIILHSTQYIQTKMLLQVLTDTAFMVVHESFITPPSRSQCMFCSYIGSSLYLVQKLQQATLRNYDDTILGNGHILPFLRHLNAACDIHNRPKIKNIVKLYLLSNFSMAIYI